MPTRSRITSKSQVTLPRSVRKNLGVGPGDELEWRNINGESVARKAVKASESPFQKWMGAVKRYPGVDTDELMKELRDR